MSIPAISMPMISMATGPMVSPAMLKADPMTVGSRSWKINRNRPSMIARMFTLHIRSRREIFLLPLMRMRAWVQSRMV